MLVPTASEASLPVMRSIAGFHDRIRWSGATTKMPSEVWAMMSASCVCCSRVSENRRRFSKRMNTWEASVSSRDFSESENGCSR